MQGWVKLNRKILESELWNDVTTFRLFMYLLLKASHTDGVEFKGFTLNKGQWVRSYRKIAEDLAYKEGRGTKQYSLKTIHKSIGKLVDAGLVTIQETEQGTLFTVVNYAKYQGFPNSERETGNGTGNQGETPKAETGNNINNAFMNNNAINELIPYVEIIDYLNQKADKHYRHTTKKTRALIKARWNEGFSLDDFKKVIDIKVSQWKNDPKMDKYLRPETLFSPKFEGYLNEKPVVKKNCVHDIPLERPKHWEKPKQMTAEELERLRKLEEEMPF